MTKNKFLASLNAADACFLALVRALNSKVHEPVYMQYFFGRELGLAETAVVIDFDDLVTEGVLAGTLANRQ